MTLGRLLLLIIALLYVSIVGGIFVISIDNTRHFLVSQLESHAQDAATSLGLSLSPHAAAGDTLFMESMVNAMFDSGYYRRIRVRSTSGEGIIGREREVRLDGVPPWFIRLLPLDTPQGSAKVMAGWRQAGIVEVTSHPGFAYRELWANARQMLQWSLASLVVALLLTSLVLRMVLRSLRAMESQAEAVADGSYPRLDPLPRTRELRRVAEAMNRMTGKVERALTEQHERVERLREQTYTDLVTGLGNQSALTRDLERLTRADDAHAYGALLLVRLQGLEGANRDGGYAAGDALLREAALAVRGVVDAVGGSAARLGGGLFAVVLPDAPRSLAQDVLDRILAVLEGVGPADGPPGANAGLAYFGGGQSAATLLERAERGLRAASQRGPHHGQLVDATQTAGGRDVTQEARWREILRRVIDERAVVLMAQEVRRLDGDVILHREVLARIRTGPGEPVAPGIFLPMAARVGLAMELDRAVVEAVIEHLGRHPEQVLAVNLSRGAALDPAFADWLSQALDGREPLAQRLAFEIGEDVAAGLADRAPVLAERVRGTGAAFGVDHCGALELRLDYLRALRPRYVKVDGAFISQIEHNLDTARFVQSLVDLVHQLDALAIAEHVETATQLELARDLGFDGAQGHHIQRPGSLVTQGG